MKKRLIVGVIVLGIIVLLRFSSVSELITFESFKQSRYFLRSYVDLHYQLAAVIFGALYIFITFFAIPSPTILTIAAGFLFGLVPAVIIVNIAATLGAIIAFLFSRYIAGKSFQKRYSAKLTSFNQHLKESGHWYLMSIRVFPFVPFSWVNFLAGLTNVDLLTFTWTTAIGIIPGSLVYVYAGKELGTANAFNDIFSPGFLSAVLLLTIIGLLPFIIKQLKLLKNRA